MLLSLPIVIALGQATATQEPEGECSFSHDGTRVVFQSYTPGGDADIFVMNADGTGRKNLTNSPGYDGEPAWRPRVRDQRGR